MGYKDFFSTADYDTSMLTPPAEQEDEQEAEQEQPQDALPEYEGVSTSDNSEVIGSLTPLSFDGFASRFPLLVERPTRFVHRVTEALRAMLIIPETDTHGGLDSRVMLSPAVILPYPFLFGNEQYPSEDVLAYPLIHQPKNKPYDGETPLEEYLLTLIAFYETQNIMTETDTGSVLAYPLPEPFEADENMWGECAAWAQAIRQPLTDLNVARLVGFSIDTLDEEQNTLDSLLDMWDIQGTGQQLIDKGAAAADTVRDLYHHVYSPDIEFQPFQKI